MLLDIALTSYELFKLRIAMRPPQAWLFTLEKPADFTSPPAIIAQRDQGCGESRGLLCSDVGNFSAQPAVSAIALAYWLYLPHSAGILWNLDLFIP
ncbi:hypothetical protein M5585_03400 [Serratia ureilytica]